MATILIAEDHPASREMLVTLLKYQQHRLLEAADGAEALALVRELRPDLIIADILMPIIDGYEFVRQIRSEPELAHTRVIFYTATFLQEEAVRLARSCGVSQLLIKPSDPEVILETVEAALSEAVVPVEAAI